MALNEGHVGDANGREERDPRIERLYRETARDEPPARIDSAILAAARREAGAGPRPLAQRLRRWHLPVSIAAIVMVSVSVVVLMQEEESKRDREPVIPAIPAPADKLAAPPALRTPPEAAKEAMQRELESPSSPRRPSRDDREAAARSGVTAGSRAEPASPAAAGVGRLEASAGKPAPQPFVAAPAPAEEQRTASTAADAAMTSGLESAPAAANQPLASRPRAEARRAAPVAGAMATKSVEQDRLPAWQGFEKEPPEKWLARIEKLKALGLEAEAQEMLSEFKHRFPEHPLPPGLK